MSVRAILVGDAPNKGARTSTPFKHAKCLPRLMSWADYVLGDDTFVLVNQVDWEAHPWEFANLFNTYHCPPLVALGVKASKFLKSQDYSHFVLPHPSGLNRKLNDKAALKKQLKKCRKYVRTLE